MNGRPHALIGAAVPLSALATGATAGQVATLSAVAALSALGPDIDHPNATISRSLPGAAHKAAIGLSRAARKATSTSSDLRDADYRTRRGHDPDHRALTHTAVAAGAWGLASYGLAHLPYGPALLLVLAGWVCRRLAPGITSLPLFAVFLSLAVGAVLHPPSPLAVGVAAGAGWLSHVVADGCTKSGVPLTWPLQVRGKCWYRTRLLGSRLTSGHPAEWGVAVVVALMFVIAPLMVR